MRIPVIFLIVLAAGAARADSIDPADILGHASAQIPFSMQRGYSAQILGKHTDVKAIPEEGIHGAALPGGETLRFGKVADPLDPSRKALAFQLHPADPATSGSKRAEISFRPSIEMEKVYWIAFSAYVYDWGRLNRGDESLFGTQVHSGDDSRGLSPSFTLGAYCCSNSFRIAVQHSTSPDPTPRNMVSEKSRDFPIAFGRWTDFVFKFRHSRGANGFLEAWRDGEKIHSYRGPMGFDTPGFKDYAKFGYYNWSSFDSSRKVLLRSPVLVLDPSGKKYAATDLRSYVSSH